MICLNFGHPLTDNQRSQLAALTGGQVEVIPVPTHLDHDRPFVDQVRKLVDCVGLSPKQWQTLPILVNPPALNTIAAILIAEVHGRMGHFPTIVRIRPVADSISTRYEVAEIVNLQQVRDTARMRRRDG